MTFTLQQLLVLLAIAATCGAVGKALAGGEPGGLVSSTALGLIGAICGPWLANQLDASERIVLHVSGEPFQILSSVIGAALFVACFHVIAEPRWVRS